MRRTALLSLLVAALVALAAGSSTVLAASSHDSKRFEFSGHLLSDPGAGASSLSVSVETGNRAALEKLIGQSQNQTFAVDSSTRYLKWTNGEPAVVTSADLKAGDWVTVKVHAPYNASLSQIESTPANAVADRGPNGRPGHRAHWLFIGTLNAAAGASSLTLHITNGNWRALRAMLGQPLDQTFTFDSGTIFLLWQGKVPTVIDASKLKVGDLISVRIRAPRDATLAQVESTPAARVADREPAPPES